MLESKLIHGCEKGPDKGSLYLQRYCEFLGMHE